MADDVVKREAQHFEAATPELWKALKGEPSPDAWPGAMQRFCDEYINWMKQNPGKTDELQAALTKDGISAHVGTQNLDIARDTPDYLGLSSDEWISTEHLACTFDKDHVTDALAYIKGEPKP